MGRNVKKRERGKEKGTAQSRDGMVVSYIICRVV